MLRLEEASRGSPEETQLLVEASNLAKKINLYRETVKVNQDAKSSNASKHAVVRTKDTGLKLSRSDIPKFQLKYHFSSFFKGHTVYPTVEVFLRQFEKTIVSAGIDIYNVWRELLPISFPPEMDNFIRDEVCVMST